MQIYHIGEMISMDSILSIKITSERDHGKYAKSDESEWKEIRNTWQDEGLGVSFYSKGDRDLEMHATVCMA